MKKFAVAVDGPAGSGKSTVAKEIAKALGILYIDTGAMYRTIGTKVLPDAEVKIYLDASVEERAKRRVGELEAQGKTADLEIIREEIAHRDYQDMHRENSPLCRAEDAVNVDTTGLDIPAVTEKLLALIAEKTK